MAKWYVTTKKADFQGIAEKFNISPIVARIIRNRELTEDAEIEKFLYGTMEDLYNPNLLKDMGKAIAIIEDKIKQEKTIRVIGDYDMDGICATYILKTGLEYCGARVDTAIPHRVKDGYGLNENLIQEAYEAGIDTIVTCDNGIAAYEQICYANSLGMTVIITDHHEVPFEEQEGEKKAILPPASAVINPKQEDCAYPYVGICGAVVAYKLIQALVEKRKQSGKILKELLEFAAIATVGDVMELSDENRILVKYGLQAMMHTKNIGLKALIEVNGLEGKELSPYHIGFVLGPCLNATGRLDTPMRALALFEAKEKAEAVRIAGDLKALNDSRKSMTEKGLEDAVAQMEAIDRKKDRVLVLYLPNCHESLAGIIAGRIRERYGKPTFILTPAEEGVKGSGRSIEAYSMYEELGKHKELFTMFGGHKMAAGLSLPADKVEIFREAMNADCSLTEEDFVEKIQIDVPVPMSYATKELTQELALLEPYGNGNPKPLFAEKGLRFLSGRIFGQKQNVGKYTIADAAGNRYEAIYFGEIEKLNRFIAKRYGEEELLALYNGKAEKIELSLVYYPEINEFRGNQNLQFVIKDYQL